jgi:hypothetical protein
MRLSRLSCAALAAAVALSAAPLARAGDLDKLLPDDAAFIVAVNVKQVRDWAPFKKQAQGEIEKVLKMDFAQNVLKDTGFDPLKDLDRLVISVSSHDAADKSPEETSFAVFQGKFDPDKLRDKAERLAKDSPTLFKVRKAGDAPMLEIALPGSPFFFVLVDKNTLVVSNVESKAAEAVEKATGKKKTGLKSKRLADLLAKSDPKMAAEWFAGGEMPTGSAKATRDKDGKITVLERGTLQDGGVEGFCGGLSLGDSDAKFQTSVFAKDAAGAKDLTKKIQEGLDKAIAEGSKEIDKRPELKPILEAMKNVKVGTADDAVTLEGSATADVIVGFIKAMGSIQGGSPPKPDR